MVFTLESSRKLKIRVSHGKGWPQELSVTFPRSIKLPRRLVNRPGYAAYDIAGNGVPDIDITVTTNASSKTHKLTLASVDIILGVLIFGELAVPTRRSTIECHIPPGSTMAGRGPRPRGSFEDVLGRYLKKGIALPPVHEGLRTVRIRVGSAAAIDIGKNLARGQMGLPAGYPTRHGISWFVSKGDPRTGVPSSADVTVEVEVKLPADPIIFRDALLLEIHAEKLAKSFEGIVKKAINKVSTEKYIEATSKARNAIEQLKKQLDATRRKGGGEDKISRLETRLVRAQQQILPNPQESPVVRARSSFLAALKQYLSKYPRNAKVDFPYTAQQLGIAKHELRNLLNNDLAMRAVEADLWAEIGQRIRTSPSGAGRVIMSKSCHLSRGRPGELVAIREVAATRIVGGGKQIVDALLYSRNAGNIDSSATGRDFLIDQKSIKSEIRRLKNVSRVKFVFRWGGRVLLVNAVGVDTYRFYYARCRLRETVRISSAWAAGLAAAGSFSVYFAPADSAGPAAWVAHGLGTMVVFMGAYWAGGKTGEIAHDGAATIGEGIGKAAVRIYEITLEDW